MTDNEQQVTAVIRENGDWRHVHIKNINIGDDQLIDFTFWVHKDTNDPTKRFDAVRDFGIFAGSDTFAKVGE